MGDLVKIKFLHGNRAGVVADMDKHQADMLVDQGLVALVPKDTMTDDERIAAVDRGDLEAELTQAEAAKAAQDAADEAGEDSTVETADESEAPETGTTRRRRRGR